MDDQYGFQRWHVPTNADMAAIATVLERERKLIDQVARLVAALNEARALLIGRDFAYLIEQRDTAKVRYERLATALEGIRNMAHWWDNEAVKLAVTEACDAALDAAREA